MVLEQGSNYQNLMRYERQSRHGNHGEFARRLTGARGWGTGTPLTLSRHLHALFSAFTGMLFVQYYLISPYCH